MNKHRIKYAEKLAGKKDTTFVDMLTYFHSNGYDSAESVFDWLWRNGFLRLKPLKKFSGKNP